MIQNQKLNKYEKGWLEKILFVDFVYKEELISQINRADIIREYTDYYLIVKFVRIYPAKGCSKYTGVLLEMRAYLENRVPIQFLLQMEKGMISELEVFKADSSSINNVIDLENVKIEILVDPKWKY